MKTWKQIEVALNEELPPGVIEEPNQRSGIYGSWVRGHTIMELANSVFGPDGWSTNVISPPKVEERVIGINNTGDERMGLAVTVIVQVTGSGLDEDGNVFPVTKTDMGWGTASASYNRQANRYDPIKPQNLRPAILGAITIGFKRCLSQFGRKLGMQLYIPDEDHMAMGWEEGATPEGQEQRPRQQQGSIPPTEDPAPTPPPSSTPPSTTVSKLAKELGIEVTETNQRFLADLGVKEIKLRQVGKTMIRTKKVTEAAGDTKGAPVSEVYASMPSYAVWMASEAATAERVSKPFKDMGIYDLYMRQCADLRYVLQGGNYEPWPRADIHDPTVQVSYSIEAAATKSMKQGLIERFPSDDEQDCNPFALKNHLNKHFQVERIGLLTWEQLAAFRLHVLEETPYPPRWAGGGEQVEEARADGGVPYKGMEMEPESVSGGPDETVDPVTPEPAEVNYSGKCADLLLEIQKQMTSEGEDGEEVEYTGNLVVFCTKIASLATANAYAVVEGIHRAVQSGNLSDTKAIETLLTTALKGLAK